ncbi:DUF7507 domain-containing protein [Christensenella massiliensis]|uniref:DUF11 domain-containing protein n=1 Tax=Christensenella massiliensis TaxID=1805714 RepID=A0AAU8A8B2_9FIRM
MKKIVAILLAAVLAVTLCISMSATAFAASSIKITASVSPGSLTGAGTVSVKVTVQNGSDGEINDVTVEFPDGDSENIGSIAAGESGTRSDSAWHVSEDMLDTDLIFSASFTDEDGDTQTIKTNPLTISKEDSKAAASASASASEDSVESGERVTFTFSLKNEGNVTLEDASLTSPDSGQFSDSQLHKTFTLEPGETKILKWTVSLKESVDISPVFTYTADGEEHTAKADRVSVTVDGAEPSASQDEDSLEVVASADKTQVSAGDTVSFEVTVRNHGSADLENLKVTDGDGNEVDFTGDRLDAGSAAKGTLELTVQETSDFVFTAKAEDEDGNTVEAKSEPIEVTVDAVDLTTALTMDVSFIPEISQAGPVDFTFKVKNNSGQELKNIVISEATLGTIATIESMTAAEQDITQQIQVAQTTSYVFTISGELPDGTKLQSQTQQPATVTVKQAAGGMGTMLILFVVIIAAIIAVAIALAVLIHKNKKAGYTAFGKRRDCREVPQRPRQEPTRNRPAERSYGQQRPPQVHQQPRQQKRQMPREQIEPRRQQPRQKQQRQPVDKKNTRYSDRNKF